MAVIFVNGLAGSGKTTYCLDKIKENIENKVYSVLLIPEQITLGMEKKAVGRVGYVGGFYDVLSFNRLFYNLYKKTDRKERKYVTKIGKTILISRAVAKISSQLLVYNKSAKFQDFSGQMLKTVTELKRHGIDFDTLKNTAEEISQSNTKAKLCDISKIYEEYTNLVNQNGDDSDDNFKILAELVEETNLSDTEFFVDCFSSFTGEELRVLEALSRKAKNLYITVKTGKGYIFDPVNNTKRSLVDLFKGIEIKEVNLNENFKHKNMLRHIADGQIGYMAKKYTKSGNEIEVFYSENPSKECEGVMQSITRKVRDEGYKFSDIGIIVADIEGYTQTLSHYFSLYDINYYISEKKSMLSNPAGLLITSFLEMVNERLTLESVIKFLKTDMTGITFDEVCKLENYALDIGIKGTKWFEEFTYKQDSYDLDEINKIRAKFVELIQDYYEKLKGKNPANVYVDALKDFIRKAMLEKRINDITYKFTKKNMPHLALEYRQVYNLIVEILNQFLICMPDESFGSEKFTDMLKSAFNEQKISIIPPESDMVMCAGPDSMRHHEFKVLYIIGANSGVFPAPFSGTGIINDAERRILEEKNIKIAPDNRKKALEQPFKIYELLCMPSDKLIISYSLTDFNGGGLAPSSTVTDIKKIFPEIVEKNINDIESIDLLCSPSASLKYVVTPDDEILKGAEKWYLENENYTKRIKYIKSAKNYRISSQLDEKTASMLWGHKLSSTISRLEAFAQCPFKFFSQYGLLLKEREVYDFNVMDRGTYLHKLLEDFVCYVVNNKTDWSSIDKTNVDEIFESIHREGTKELYFKIPQPTLRHEFLIEKLKESAKNALWAVVKQVQAGKFVPYITELNLAEDKNVTPITFKSPQGRDITLYGKIDRVDISEDKEFRIIDYKSGGKKLDLCDVYDGVSLQLFVYSNALKDKFGQSRGMFYFGISPQVSAREDLTVEEDSLKLKSYRLDGCMVGGEDTLYIMDSDAKRSSSVVGGSSLTYSQYNNLSKRVFEKIGEYADDIISGKTSINPYLKGTSNACTYCPYISVCGFDAKYDKYDEHTSFDVLEKISEEGENV